MCVTQFLSYCDYHQYTTVANTIEKLWWFYSLNIRRAWCFFCPVLGNLKSALCASFYARILSVYCYYETRLSRVGSIRSKEMITYVPRATRGKNYARVIVTVRCDGRRTRGIANSGKNGPLLQQRVRAHTKKYYGAHVNRPRWKTGWLPTMRAFGPGIFY